MLEGPGVGHPEQIGGPIGVGLAEYPDEMPFVPSVSESLDAIGVGVERGGEAVLGRAQLAEEEVNRLLRNALREAVTGEPPELGIDAYEQSVVVQHLFKMWHGPGL